MLVWTCPLKQSWGPFKRGAVSQKSTERKRTVLQGKSWPSSCFHLKKSCKCLERNGEEQRGYVSVIIVCVVLFTYWEFDFESNLKIEVDFHWWTAKINIFATKFSCSDFAKRAVDIHFQGGYKFRQEYGYSLSTLGSSYRYLGQYVQAERFLKEALKIFRSVDAPSKLRVTVFTLFRSFL